MSTVERKRTHEATDSTAPEFPLAREVIESFREYAQRNPEVTALWCLGIGFVLGWKLKPW